MSGQKDTRERQPIRDEAGWVGHACLVDQGLLYRGSIGATALHAHHAFQFMFAVRGELAVDTSTSRHFPKLTAFLIEPDSPHAVRTSCPDAVVFWVDPEMEAGRKLKTRIRHREVNRSGTGFVTLGEFPLPALPDLLDTPTARLLSATILDALGIEGHRPGPMHPAVLRTSRAIPGALDRCPALEEFARIAGLSASRLGHLFREQTGSTFRGYVRWCRLKRAIESLREGSNLTAAAHVAGFSDAAHLSRSFRRMFGLTPSRATSSIQWLG